MGKNLPENGCAQLLETLEYSLLTESEKTDRDAWLNELERRVAEVASGEVETIDGEQEMAEAHEMLRNLRQAR